MEEQRQDFDPRIGEGVVDVWPIHHLGTVAGREEFRALLESDEHPEGSPTNLERVVAVFRDSARLELANDREGQLSKARALMSQAAPLREYVEYGEEVIEQATEDHERWSNSDKRQSWEQAERERLHRLSLTDALTGLPNRRGMQESLRSAHEWCSEAPPGMNRYLVVLVIDADDFKKVNDTYGHDPGDQMLVSIAKHIKTRSSTDETFRLVPSAKDMDPMDPEGARSGGDEFTVIARIEMSDEELDGAEKLAAEEAEPAQASAHIPSQTRSEQDVVGPKEKRVPRPIMDQATGFASRLKEELDTAIAAKAEELHQIYGQDISEEERPRPGVSIGVGVGDRSRTVETILHEADRNMNEEKGHNKRLRRLEEYAAAREHLSAEDMAAVRRVREALEGVPYLGPLRNSLDEFLGDKPPDVDTR